MNIIVVDDEALALRTLIKAITNLINLANVVGFEFPEDALTYAGKNRVDVAFLDIEMAEMNGLFLAKKLKDIYGDTNIIFVTGHSQYALDAFSVHASDYLLKPVSMKRLTDALENLRKNVELPKAMIRIKCFGNFEVFAEKGPLTFKRTKSKEILAYLVDRKGALASTREIAAILWEDAAYDRNKQKQLNVLIAEMISALREVGAGNLVVKKWGYYGVDPTQCYCDYYAYESGNMQAVNSYHGEYMVNYSWAEFTAGWLTNKE